MEGMILIKILTILGSPRKHGNTHLLANEILFHIDSDSYQSEVIFLNSLDFNGCIGCNGCKNSTNCVIQDDMQILYQKMFDADALIIGSPTYYYNVTSFMKKFIDRLFCLNIFDEDDRTKWTSYNHIHGKKPAVVISVCEQESKDDIGFTTKAMSKPLEDIGYNIVFELEAIKSFNKGDILHNMNALKDAETCAKALMNSLQ